MLNFKQSSVVVSFCALIIGHNAYSNDNNIALDTTVLDDSAPLPEIAANNDTNSINETNNNESLTWPLLPGESLTDTAKQFYPKNKQQQQLFIKKALLLNADSIDALDAETTFDEAKLLNIPSLKTIAKQSKANKRKPKKKTMQLSYRIKDVVEGVPAYLVRQYEALLAKNSFLKIEIEKLNKKIEFLQNKIFDLKLVLDKTLDLSALTNHAMPNADVKNTTTINATTATTTISADASVANAPAKPMDVARNFDVTIVPNDKTGVVDLNAKKVFKNLDVQKLDVQKPATATSTQLSPKILPQATALAEESSTSFIENNKNQSWSVIKNTPSWRSWGGLAYEAICIKHQEAIKKALGISGMYSDVSSWKYVGKDGADGTQIDLLIDRSDKCINLCEIKFSESEFVIDKQYAAKIQQKISIFKEQTNTRKTIFFTAISTYGFKENEYKLRWVQNEVVMNDLFL